MTPEQRRALLGDDVVEHCHRIAAQPVTWSPDQLDQLAALLFGDHDTQHDTAA